jgi:hypothetical protein
MKKLTKADRIREAITENPTASHVAIAAKVGCDQSYVWMVRRKLKKEGVVVSPYKSVPYPPLPVAKSPSKAVTHDEVNSPPHYTVGGIETIDYIQAKLSPEEFRGYCLGNALKYMSRIGKKGDATVDLKKAKWYIDRITTKD